MAGKRTDSSLAAFLLIYLLIVGVGAAVVLILTFPTEIVNDSGQRVAVFPPLFLASHEISVDQGFLLLAFLAGVTGSFLHAAQSLSSYLGNQEFKGSWTVWYFLRPWIGGVLGLAIYFTFRAGLVAGASTVNPYGVVALGLLGGWFSKTTGDKLQEVFETLFKTESDRKRKDKLQAGNEPLIDAIVPSPIPPDQDEIKLIGRHFLDGATVLIGGRELEAELVAESELRVSLSPLGEHRPGGGAEVLIRVLNPEGAERLSAERPAVFE